MATRARGERRGWTTRVTLLWLALVLALAMPALGAFHEDPYKVLGVARGATESDIKRAYRALALKWHPDKNPGNPDAEKQFMRIGAAYDQLTSGDFGSPQQQQQRYGNGYGNNNRYSQQQWQWQQQQQRQRQYYQQQQGMSPFPFSFSFSTIAMLGLFVWVMVVLPTYMQSDAASAEQRQSNNTQQQGQQQKANDDDEPRASPHEQLARVFAPSLFAFKPLYLTARGRRLLLFFPDSNAFGSNVRDQFSVLEKLASEFARDPVTFCWLDLATLPAAQRAKWEAQFSASQNTSASPFLAAFTSKGKKVAMYSPPRATKVDADDARKWISRLLGGEIPQEEALPVLFTN